MKFTIFRGNQWEIIIVLLLTSPADQKKILVDFFYTQPESTFDASQIFLIRSKRFSQIFLISNQS
ncbi:hypothetical protein ASE92_01005 [Pedobacter sp. Leaf41]|nr:hypothetical protein ASE92_01005 [Pedobacter sp. Leaf41]